MNASRIRSLFLAGVFLATSVQATPLIRRASVGANRVQGSDASPIGAMSSDGRYVAFASSAPNLTGDGLGGGDFLRDRLNGTIERIPLIGSDLQMSRDARYVATNDATYIRVYDRTNATTTTLFSDAGTFQLSGDGRHLVFTSTFFHLPADQRSGEDIYVYDLDTATLTLASVASDGTQGNAPSVGAAISANGRYVAFNSSASNLVPGDTNNLDDVFVRDLVAGTTVRVSVATGGAQVTDGNAQSDMAISDDGQVVAFRSNSSQLVPGDTNGQWDIFVHDITSGTTTRVSVSSGGAQGLDGSFNPILSGDGRWVAFSSGSSLDAQPGGGFFLHDRQAATTTRLTHPSAFPSHILGLSPDGRFALFSAADSDIVVADTNEPGNGQSPPRGFDVFVYDQASTCGNGTLEQDEDCDDGNTVGGDGCEPDCLRTLCFAGAVIDGVRLRIRPSGALTMKGDLVLPPGVPATFDPSTTGVQIAVEDVGLGRSVLEFSSRTGSPVRGGTACDVADGWLVRHAGTIQRYLNRRSDALDPPLCTPGTARALKSVRFRDRRATKGVVSFALQTSNFGTIPRVAVAGPLRMTVVFGVTAAAGLAGDCGTHTFALADCAQQGGTTSCK